MNPIINDYLNYLEKEYEDLNKKLSILNDLMSYHVRNNMEINRIIDYVTAITEIHNVMNAIINLKQKLILMPAQDLDEIDLLLFKGNNSYEKK